ncbi:MAG: CHC2 zinc finger domain-containing protein [Bryobacteraceae bacterium]
MNAYESCLLDEARRGATLQPWAVDLLKRACEHDGIALPDSAVPYPSITEEAAIERQLEPESAEPASGERSEPPACEAPTEAGSADSRIDLQAGPEVEVEVEAADAPVDPQPRPPQGPPPRTPHAAHIGQRPPFSPGEVARYYAVRAPRIKQTSAKEWRGACPLHGGTRDSFAIQAETGLWHCHSECNRGGSMIEFEMAFSGLDFRAAARAVDDAVGRRNGHNPQERVAAEYTYTDERGRPLFRVIRLEPKNFRQKRWDGQGWKWGLGDTRRVLYNLEAVCASDLVVCCEGEKDVETLRSLGRVATCNPMGAGKWRSEYSQSLKGKTVIIVPDNDEPGRKHAAEVAESLLSIAEQVYASIVPEPHKDVSDWVKAASVDAAAVDRWLGQATRIESKDDIYKLWPEAAPPEDHEEHVSTAEPAPPPPSPSDEDAPPPELEQPRPGAADGPQRESQATKLLRLVSDVELFHSQDRAAFARFSYGGHFEIHPVQSKSFRQFLQRRYYTTTRVALSAKGLQDGLGVLAASALFDGPEFPVFTRVGSLGDSLFIDLGTDDWDAIEITSEGWAINPSPPVRFRRAPGILPLPKPIRSPHGSEYLRELLNTDSTSHDHALVVAFLMATMRPAGPFPVLVLCSEAGSGKTTLARMLRSFIDPHVVSVRTQPCNPRDLMIAATNSWVMSIDNISHVDDWLSDCLCQLSTGGGFATRELYSDLDETLINVQRPVILNGIEEIVTRGDLLDRSLLVRLPAIPESKRRPERELWGRFEQQRPAIMAYLLDACVGALANLGSVHLESTPRMADFATWVAAAEPALGWPKGHFIDSYSENRQEATTITLEASPIGRHVLQLRSAVCGQWEGTAKRLLEQINSQATMAEQKLRSWPQTARGMSNALRRLVQSLRNAGVCVNFTRESGTRERERLITITWGNGYEKWDTGS